SAAASPALARGVSGADELARSLPSGLRGALGAQPVAPPVPALGGSPVPVPRRDDRGRVVGAPLAAGLSAAVLVPRTPRALPNPGRADARRAPRSLGARRAVRVAGAAPPPRQGLAPRPRQRALGGPKRSPRIRARRGGD